MTLLYDFAGLCAQLQPIAVGLAPPMMIDQQAAEMLHHVIHQAERFEARANDQQRLREGEALDRRALVAALRMAICETCGYMYGTERPLPLSGPCVCSGARSLIAKAEGR